MELPGKRDGEPTHAFRQITAFEGWLRAALRSLISEIRTPGQCLVFSPVLETAENH
jgi:hypothetical protein